MWPAISTVVASEQACCWRKPVLLHMLRRGLPAPGFLVEETAMLSVSTVTAYDPKMLEAPVVLLCSRWAQLEA